MWVWWVGNEKKSKVWGVGLGAIMDSAYKYEGDILNGYSTLSIHNKYFD